MLFQATVASGYYARNDFSSLCLLVANAAKIEFSSFIFPSGDFPHNRAEYGDI
jgi:hypothetical protein